MQSRPHPSPSVFVKSLSHSSGGSTTLFPHIGPPPLLDELDELLLDELLLDALDELLLDALDELLLDELLLDEELDELLLDEEEDDVMPLDEEDDEDVMPLDDDELVSPLDEVELDVVLGSSPRLIVPSSSKAQAETNAPTVRANPEMVKMANDLEYWRI